MVIRLIPFNPFSVSKYEISLIFMKNIRFFSDISLARYLRNILFDNESEMYY